MKLGITTRYRLAPRMALTVGLILCGQSAGFAAGNISGFVDETGRVVFVNDSSEPSAGSALTKSQTSQVSSKRKVVATSSAFPGLSESSAEPTALEPGLRSAPLSGESGPLSRPGQITGRDRIQELVSEMARSHKVDAGLVHAIVRVESNYNPYAVSNKGARGLMQLIPATARRFGVYNSFDPRANLDGGIRYLKYLMGMFKGDLRLSLAAYNAGENAVVRNGGVPPYRETQDYIRKIHAMYPMRTVAAVVGVPAEPQILRYVDDGGVVHFSNTDTP